MTVPDIESPHDEAARVQAALTDYQTRQRIISNLRRTADDSNSRGDLASAALQYDVATAAWGVAARCVRSAQLIGGGKPTLPEDYPIVRTAYREAMAAVGGGGAA